MRLGAVVAALVAISSALSGASGAKAADMTPLLKAPGPSYIPAQFNWTGYYLGVSTGWGTGKANFTDLLPTAAGATSSARLSGFLVGGVTGINYQIGSIVVGLEGDFTGSWAKGNVIDSAGDTMTNEVMWTSTVGARLGWAWDRWMIYAKGGGAFDQDRTTVASGGGSDIGGTYRSGWNVGGGAEWAFTEHWIIRFAYDYMKFPSKLVTLTGSIPLTGGILGNAPAGANVGVTLNEFKAVLEYKF
jgi:outer membrane immunogenic protein